MYFYKFLVQYIESLMFFIFFICIEYMNMYMYVYNYND